MSNIVLSERRVPAMSGTAIAKVRELQTAVDAMPQISIETDHVIHGGMYARTITIEPGTILAGALIKVPTTLIVNGSCRVFLGNESVDLHGYHVLAASAGRKQAFVAFEKTQLTMIFATEANSVDAAEDQFTEEAGQLMSRRDDAVNTVIITGE